MHISLTRRAARGNTSWYLRHGATPRPAAHPAAHHHRAHHRAHLHRAHHKRHLTAAERRRRNHHIYYRRHHRHHRHHWRHHWSDHRSAQTSQPSQPGQTSTDPKEDQGAGVSQNAWENLADRFQVSAGAADGTLSSATFKAGDQVQVVVGGKMGSGDQVVDAACEQTSGGWAQRNTADTAGSEPLTVLVNGHERSFAPVYRGDACSTGWHLYKSTLTLKQDGKLRVKVSDDDYSNNWGTLEVALFRG
jgi:hypothetical protein